MATFVLVPGAWLGGWCLSRVTSLLRAAGHSVFPITLTGLGERVHLASPEVDLGMHIKDVTNVLEYEDLRNVMLLGHSYAGMVVTGVAERVPEWISQLIYLAAAVPQHGESLFDGWSPEGRAAVEEEARSAGESWRWPLPVNLGDLAFGLTEADERWMRPKAVPHPLATFVQSVELVNSQATTIPRTFVRCTAEGSRLPPAVQQDPDRWRLRDLPAGHWPMISMPRELADILTGLV